MPAEARYKSNNGLIERIENGVWTTYKSTDGNVQIVTTERGFKAYKGFQMFLCSITFGWLPKVKEYVNREEKEVLGPNGAPIRIIATE